LRNSSINFQSPQKAKLAANYNWLKKLAPKSIAVVWEKLLDKLQATNTAVYTKLTANNNWQC
jgi:hypothetical protein